MNEEHDEKKVWFDNLKNFDELDLVLSYLPKGFEIGSKDIIMDQNRIVAVFPKQEVPEDIAKQYTRKLGYSVEFMKKLLTLFKKEHGITFHFPKKDFPLMIEGRRYLTFLAPQITEEFKEEEDDE